MSIRTKENLTDRLAEDLIWRKKELTVLKKLVTSASTDRRVALTRSLLALLYAHWEGFIKNAGLCYLQYLAPRRLRYCELTSNFVAIEFRSRIREASSQRNLSELIRIIELFRGRLNERSKIPQDAVDTESNLSSRVLRDLTYSLGLDYAPFETKAVLIDERLLGNRNRIAHGEHLTLEVDDIVDLVKKIVALMENFRDQIENAVALSKYRNSA